MNSLGKLQTNGAINDSAIKALTPPLHGPSSLMAARTLPSEKNSYFLNGTDLTPWWLCHFFAASLIYEHSFKKIHFGGHLTALGHSSVDFKTVLIVFWVVYFCFFSASKFDIRRSNVLKMYLFLCDVS